MARIVEFFEAPSDSAKVHGNVECGYRVFTSPVGTILQLDTYGSRERAVPGKVSQSIQLDEDGAKELVRILLTAFPEVAQAWPANPGIR